MTTKAPPAKLMDDQISAVQIGDGEVRGRILRLGSSLDQVLGANRYPDAVATLLGEAVMISALVASSLKFKGRLLVQAHGRNEGAVSLLAAECTTNGHMRAYARFDESSLERIIAENPRPDAKTLTGGGSFAMTIDPGSGKDRYQGISAIEGASLAACAEHFFKQSEQIPTRIKLAVGRLHLPGAVQEWRGGGILIQRMAEDATRGDANEAWDMSKALLATLKDEELLDPDLGSEHLLYRLFHEQGVRMDIPMDVLAKCSCSRKRLLSSIKTFAADQREEMFKDGKITASCEFCATDYVFIPQDLTD